MNKRDAQERAQNITRKELEDILYTYENFDAPCKLNKTPGFTKVHAWKIFIDALDAFGPDEPVRERIAINILREFA